MQEFVKARGLCFRVVQWGQGTNPILLLHGVHGTAESWEGLIQALNGAPLRGSSDWYLLRQIQNFRSGVRGTKPEDTSGALMRPMSLTLPDEQAIIDVIAYITTLPGSH